MERQGEAVRKRIAVSAVSDSKTGDLIVKLVNMLPVAVKPALTLEGYELDNARVVKHVLSGEPGDKAVCLIESSCSVDEMLVGELAPYSFTVYRVKQSVKKR